MMRCHSRRSPSRALIFVLTLLVLVGHACELPAFAEVFTHTHEGAHDSTQHHHSSDQHGDDDQASCDAADARLRRARARRTGVRLQSRSLDACDGFSVARVVVSQVAAAPPRESSGLPRRLPLFLLHASLLI